MKCGLHGCATKQNRQLFCGTAVHLPGSKASPGQEEEQCSASFSAQSTPGPGRHRPWAQAKHFPHQIRRNKGHAPIFGLLHYLFFTSIGATHLICLSLTSWTWAQCEMMYLRGETPQNVILKLHSSKTFEDKVFYLRFPVRWKDFDKKSSALFCWKQKIIFKKCGKIQYHILNLFFKEEWKVEKKKNHSSFWVKVKSFLFASYFVYRNKYNAGIIFKEIQ